MGIPIAIGFTGKTVSSISCKVSEYITFDYSVKKVYPTNY